MARRPVYRRPATLIERQSAAVCRSDDPCFWGGCFPQRGEEDPCDKADTDCTLRAFLRFSSSTKTLLNPSERSSVQELPRPQRGGSPVDATFMTGSRPTAEQLQRDYLDVGSDGLHTFAKIRNITGANMAATLAKTPAIYSDVKPCAAVLPAVRERLIQEATEKLMHNRTAIVIDQGECHSSILKQPSCRHR